MRSMLLFIALMLVGCATLPTPEEMRADIENFDLPKLPEEGKALVYIIRPRIEGILLSFHVFLDDKEPGSEMGYTGPREYIYFNLEPGDHQILSTAFLQSWSGANVTVKAGDIRFILQIGPVIKIPDYEGRYYVKQLSLGTIIRMDK